LQALPEVEKIILWDEDADALATVQRNNGDKVEATYTDLDKALARDDLAFLIMAMPNDVGPDIAIRAFEAGHHVMAEKPIGNSAAAVERAVKAAERLGRSLGVVYQNRYNPVPVKARELIHGGILGKVVSMEARLLTTQVRFRRPEHWLFKKEIAGGGILSWLGCHYIDMMRYVSGDEIVSVSAEVATLSGEAINVEDTASLSFQFRSGAIGSLHAAYVLALSGGGYFGSGYDSYFGFRGREGRLFWDPQSKPPRLYAESTRPEWVQAPIRNFQYELPESAAYGGRFGEQFIRDFYLASQGKATPPTTGRDALQVARIIEAAYESSRTGRRVEVEAP
jgi:predicted dehydrogenase